MNKRLAVQWFVTGERLTMFMSCKNCDAPLISFRARVLGVCAGCLKNAGVEIGKLLIVPPPPPSVNVKAN